MEITQKQYIAQFNDIMQQLPETKLQELYDYAIYLVWQSNIVNKQNLQFKKNEPNIKRKLTIPSFTCNGMKENFNREDLYEIRL